MYFNELVTLTQHMCFKLVMSVEWQADTQICSQRIPKKLKLIPIQITLYLLVTINIVLKHDKTNQPNPINTIKALGQSKSITSSEVPSGVFWGKVYSACIHFLFIYYFFVSVSTFIQSPFGCCISFFCSCILLQPAALMAQFQFHLIKSIPSNVI